MEELIFRIGEMLDQKLEEKLDQKLEEILDQKLDKILDQKLDKMLDQKLDKILDKKLDQKIQLMEERLEKKFDKKFEEMKKEVLDHQFLFEENYGRKIDAIYDAVTMELDKNLEKSEKIRRLSGRMDRSEVTIFDHEKRISVLERNK